MSAAQIDPVKLERKRALQRAGLAAVAALVLLIGVLVADDGREPESVVTSAPELPVLAAESTPALAAPAEDNVAEDKGVESAGAESKGADSSDAVSAGPVQSPVAANEQSAGAVPSQAQAPAAPEMPAAPTADSPGADNVLATSQASTAPQSPTSASTTPAAPLPDGYLVQLGVFGAMENAEALRANIAALGLPVRIEGRVVVGPFRDKAAADAAQGKLRREGVAVGFVVPPRAAGARSGK